MAHFAEIDSNNIVLQVLVIPDEEEHRGQDYIANDLGLGGRWLQTSYNSRGNVHYTEDKIPSGKPALRKNFAGPGFTYDPDLDAFIEPKPYPSWILNEETCMWESPVPMPIPSESDITPPTVGGVKWDESSQSWEIIPIK